MSGMIADERGILILAQLMLLPSSALSHGVATGIDASEANSRSSFARVFSKDSCNFKLPFLSIVARCNISLKIRGSDARRCLPHANQSNPQYSIPYYHTVCVCADVVKPLAENYRGGILVKDDIE